MSRLTHNLHISALNARALKSGNAVYMRWGGAQTRIGGGLCWCRFIGVQPCMVVTPIESLLKS